MEKMDKIEARLKSGSSMNTLEPISNEPISWTSLIKEDSLIHTFATTSSIQGERARKMISERSLFVRVKITLLKSVQKGALTSTRDLDISPQKLIQLRR